MSITQLVLARRPGALLDAADVTLIEKPVPQPSAGEFRARLSHITLDVSMIGWMREQRSYLPGIALGDPIRAAGVGIVEDSQHPDYAPGDLVTGLFQCGTHALSDGKVTVKLDAQVASARDWAGSLGLTTAFTSFVGLGFAPGDLRGKTVFVTGASGLVGGFAAQFARNRGARVIGTAGTEATCRDVEANLNVDYCLNYNTVESLPDTLKDLCPDRIDVFFDNVGGHLFDAGLSWMNAFGTVVMCGQTAERGRSSPTPVSNIRDVIMERLTVRGFVVFDHPDQFVSAAKEIAQGIVQGRLGSPHDNICHEGGLAMFFEAYDVLVNDDRKGKHVLCL